MRDNNSSAENQHNQQDGQYLNISAGVRRRRGSIEWRDDKKEQEQREQRSISRSLHFAKPSRTKVRHYDYEGSYSVLYCKAIFNAINVFIFDR